MLPHHVAPGPLVLVGVPGVQGEVAGRVSHCPSGREAGRGKGDTQQGGAPYIPPPPSQSSLLLSLLVDTVALGLWARAPA